MVTIEARVAEHHRTSTPEKSSDGGDVVGGSSAVHTRSECEPRAVAHNFVPGINQQSFRLAYQLFIQVRLLFEDGVDI